MARSSHLDDLPTAEEMQPLPQFPALKCVDKNGCEWLVLIPNYSIAIPKCPKCGRVAVSLSWGGLHYWPKSPTKSKG